MSSSGNVVILDYGAGNLRSVVRAVERVGFSPCVTDDPAALDTAAALIVPGVGAAADTMANLRRRGLVQPLTAYIAQGRPFLGVCMGLQALMTVSEEGGEHPCLDIVPGRVIRLQAAAKIPHMGWNAVHTQRPSSLFQGIPPGSHFYFVHAYHCVPDDPAVVLATTDYEEPIVAVIERDNVVATQFHPEKSGPNGLRIYRNFLRRALLPPAPPGS